MPPRGRGDLPLLRPPLHLVVDDRMPAEPLLVVRIPARGHAKSVAHAGVGPAALLECVRVPRRAVAYALRLDDDQAQAGGHALYTRRGLGAGMTAALPFQLTDEDVDRIAARVVAKLRLVPPPDPTHYTTSKAGPHIPGKSRRWMLDHVCLIPGARKEGRDWVIAIAAYEAWATREDLRKCGVRKVQTAPVHTSTKKLHSTTFDEADLKARVARSMSAQGYRLTK